MTDKSSFEIADTATRNSRKKREAALMLPALGFCLLLSPLVGAFLPKDGLWGISTGILYIFGVWAGLIILALLLSLTLGREMQGD